jgi:glutamate racemase
MIGVFDSGSGGLTILTALQKQLPSQDFLYLGDHANAPYGHRSNQQIVDLTRAGVDSLMAQGCKLVVLACNTAAAVALRSLQKNWLPSTYPNRRILGVLVPMVEALTGVPWSQEHPSAEPRPAKKIALFATRKTVESGAYSDEVQKRAPHLKLIGKACPGLVDAIEGGAGPLPLAGMITGYVNEISCPDAVVLGCTHFPLVVEHFKAALPENTPIFSQPEIVAQSLVNYLQRHTELSSTGSGKIELLTTGDPSELSHLKGFLPSGGSAFCKFKT